MPFPREGYACMSKDTVVPATTRLTMRPRYLASLGFDGAKPSTTGRPSYHPGVLLKIYIYGYLNRV